jgi:chromosome segregation protein
LEDSQQTQAKSESEAEKARAAVETSKAAMEKAETDFAAATQAETAAVDAATRADAALVAAETARSETQSRESTARAERSEAEGEMNALRAEVAALAKLLERDTAEGGQILDRLQVEQGFEKALGASLADDLRAPEVEGDGPSGWTVLPRYDAAQDLPAGVTALTSHVSVPDVLSRRMGQIGLVDADEGSRLQPLLKPGQRLVSLEGDLWRWDGYRACRSRSQSGRGSA